MKKFFHHDEINIFDEIYLIIIHTTTIWHEFIDKLNRNPNDKFFVTQNKGLRTMVDVFKTTSIWILKTKKMISSFNIHFNKLQTKTRMRLKNSNHSQQIKIVHDKTTRRLREMKKRPVRWKFISKQKKMV